LDFPVVITTNYDQLFEQALRDVGKQPRVAIYTPRLEETVDYRKPTAQSPIVFNIHGDISRPETIVITDEDYIDFVLRMSNKEPYDPLPRRLKVYLRTGRPCSLATACWITTCGCCSRRCAGRSTAPTCLTCTPWT